MVESAERSWKYIVYEKQEEGIVIITFNVPERLNTMRMYDHLPQDIVGALDVAEADPDVKVIVFRGAGRAFCAGHDLHDPAYKYWFGTPEQRRVPQHVRLKALHDEAIWVQRVFLCPKITIAQVHGFAFGAGEILVRACDLAVASADARIGHAEQRWGHGGQCWLLADWIMTVGRKRANELMLTTRSVTAQEAADLGWINRAVPPEKLEEETMNLAKCIALQPRDSIWHGKLARLMAEERLGLMSGFYQHPATISLYFGSRLMPDEFSLPRAMAEKGLGGAIAERAEQYSKLGYPT